MSKWKNVSYGCDTNPGVWDANGALTTIEENSEHPGVERVTVASYCGRDTDDCRYYRPAKGEGVYDTIAQAQRAWLRCGLAS